MVVSNSRRGFTLAEVLVTLAIIGVVAAMSIPSLIQSTNQTEYKVSLKKAISVLNSAMGMSVALDNQDSSASTDSATLFGMFAQRLNVISSDATNKKLTTADGMTFTFVNGGTTGCTGDIAAATAPTAPGAGVCTVLVDVNGENKKPGQLSTGNGTTDAQFGFKDQYYLVIKGRQVIPMGNDTVTAAQYIMYH